MTNSSAPSAVILRSSDTLVVTNWRFRPSAPSSLTRLRRLRLLGRSAPPDARILRAPWSAERWNCLFLFVPTGIFDDDQREMLHRLRMLSGKLLIVVATPAPDVIPDETDHADALIWKTLPGFDFSAYALALAAIATFSPGATVYVQNDSVLGPFGDLDAMIRTAPWDLTGFIASSAVENHISSFAFVLKDVTPTRMAALAPILSTAWSQDDFAHVVLLLETRFARIAARAMTVGSFWYLPVRPTEPSLVEKIAQRLGFATASALVDARGDATLGFPLSLLDRGFPFLKRSLFTKFAGIVPEAALRERLATLGWPESATDQSSGSRVRRLAADPQKASGS